MMSLCMLDSVPYVNTSPPELTFRLMAIRILARHVHFDLGIVDGEQSLPVTLRDVHFKFI